MPAPYRQWQPGDPDLAAYQVVSDRHPMPISHWAAATIMPPLYHRASFSHPNTLEHTSKPPQAEAQLAGPAAQQCTPPTKATAGPYPIWIPGDPEPAAYQVVVDRHPVPASCHKVIICSEPEPFESCSMLADVPEASISACLAVPAALAGIRVGSSRPSSPTEPEPAGKLQAEAVPGTPTCSITPPTVKRGCNNDSSQRKANQVGGRNGSLTRRLVEEPVQRLLFGRDVVARQLASAASERLADSASTAASGRCAVDKAVAPVAPQHDTDLFFPCSTGVLCCQVEMSKVTSFYPVVRP